MNDFKNILEDYTKEEDVNHWLRRFYRCYIDGSYTGSDDYTRNLRRIRDCKGNKKKLESFAKQKFQEFIQVEFPIKRDRVVQTIKDTLTPEQNQKLIAELVDDCMDLILD